MIRGVNFEKKTYTYNGLSISMLESSIQYVENIVFNAAFLKNIILSSYQDNFILQYSYDKPSKIMNQYHQRDRVNNHNSSTEDHAGTSTSSPADGSIYYYYVLI